METIEKNKANAVLYRLRMKVIDLQFFLNRKTNFDAIYTARTLNHHLSLCDIGAKNCLDIVENPWSKKEILGILANIDSIREELFQNPENHSYNVSKTLVMDHINTILGVLGDCNWES